MCKYYRDEPNVSLTDSESFKDKIIITGKTSATGNEKDGEILALLKNLSKFWRTLQMSLINREVNLILTLNFKIKNLILILGDTKLYIPVVTL